MFFQIFSKIELKLKNLYKNRTWLQLTPLTNDTKKNLWTRIKELTGWMNSKSELNTTVREESFIYKIKY